MLKADKQRSNGSSGPSVAGKTYSALLLAYGLINDWSKAAVIDTENHFADLYANYQVLALKQPSSPERYIQAIEVCVKAGININIIDSISHECLVLRQITKNGDIKLK